MPVLEVWNEAFDFDTIVDNMADKEMKRYYSKKLAKTTEQSAHEKEFAKLTFDAGATPRIVDQPPLIFHYGDQRDQQMRENAEKTLMAYRESLIPSRRLLLDRFELVDYAMKVVGVGSVGTFCGILLLMSGNGDPLFLQFKEARRSVLEPYCGASPFGHAGRRVVAGQHAMQAASDIFLGWATGTGDRKPPFLHPAVERRQDQARDRDHEGGESEGLCPIVRHGAGSSPRPLGRCGGLERLHG